MSATVRKIIIRTLASFDIILDECLVTNIEVEVRRRCHTSPKGLAYVIARNKASDIINKRLRAKKYMTKKLLRQEKKRQAQELLNRLKKEFVQAQENIMASVSRAAKRNAKRNMDLCFLRIMNGLHISEIQEKFYPELSKVVIRKGIQRGRELFLQSNISAKLQNKLISTQKKNKKSSTSTRS